MGRFLHYVLTALLIAFIVPTVNAGTLKGRVSDKRTGEPIFDVVVALSGTNYSTLTGLDGSYRLSKIPAGQYTVVAMFATYKKYSTQITISEDQEIVLNISLSENTRQMKGVEIKTQYVKGSDREARNLEKKADHLMNVMSARTIQLLPDIIISNVMQRVSGVQVQRNANGNARYAIIRGMDKRYNYTSIDGVKIPSPDDKGRYVPMDIFPSSIVERLEVIKTLTPDMEADAIGGRINMVLKTAPDTFLLKMSVATGYNQNSFNHPYTSFDRKGINKVDPFKKNGADYAATPNDFQNNTLHYKNDQAKPNALINFSIGNRFLKNKQLGVIVSGSYQNTYKNTSSIFFLPSVQPGVVDTVGNVPAITDLNVYKYSTQNTRSALHAKIDYRLNSKNKISLYALRVQADQNQYRNIIDTTVQINRIGAGSGPVDISDRSAFRRKRISNLTFHGDHYLAHNLNLNYSLTYTKALGWVPDMTLLHVSQAYTANAQTGSIDWKPGTLSSIVHSWQKTNDADATAYVNLIYKPEIRGHLFEIKTGGMHRNKNRNNYYNNYTLKPVAAKPVFTNIDDANVTVQNPKGLQPYNDLSYTINEQITDAYIQAKTMILSKLQLLTGVRMEHTYLKYTIQMDPSNFVGQNATYNYTDVLPGVHFKYFLTKKADLRMSYFGAITRPSFFELVPYTFKGENLTEVGNYNLKHTTANNFDVRYEYFPKGLDEILIGGFYKKITNAIEYAFVHVGSGASKGALQPQNLSNPATNYGAEIQIIKYFHSFGISANYTYTHSSVNAEKKSRVRKSDNSGDTVLYVHQMRPLQGQAAHIANVTLILKNQRWGLDANLTWTYTGRHISFISNFIGLDYWQKGTSFFGLSLEKKLGKRLSAFVKIQNLLNSAVRIELPYSKKQFVSKDQTYQLPYQTLPNNLLVRKDKYGRNYLVGLRFKIN